MKRGKKRTYWHYLIKYLLIFSILTVIILCICLRTEWMRLYHLQVESISNYLSTTEKKIADVLRDKPMEEALPECIYHTTGLARNSWLEIGPRLHLKSLRPFSLITIEDAETGEILYDSGTPHAILRVYDESKDHPWDDDMANQYFRVDPYQYYVCTDDSIRELYEAMTASTAHGQELCTAIVAEKPSDSGGGYSISCRQLITDYYLKDRQFLLSQVSFLVEGNMHSSDGRQDAFEYTTEWKSSSDYFEGYEHIIVPEGNRQQPQKDQARPSFNSKAPYLTFPDINISAQTEKERAEALAQLNSLHKSAAGEFQSGYTTSLLHILPESISFYGSCLLMDQTGRVYLLSYYNKYDRIRISSFTGGLSFLPFLAAAPFLLAWIGYSRKKYLLMTAEYRDILMDSMAHDLKSPLMAISGYTENLRDILESSSGKKLELHYADQILDNVNYMNSIVKKNAEILKYDRQTKKVIRKPVKLNELFEDTLNRYQGEIQKKKLAVTMSGELTEKGDEALLQKVAENLITNAIHYTPDSGKIEILFVKHQFTISNTTDIPYTGNLKKLWEPFVRGDDSRTGRGTGLGLAIVANILDRHRWNYRLKYDSSNKTFLCTVHIPIGIYL